MHTKHAEFKAGIVVLLAIGILLAGLFLTSGAEWPWTKHREIHLRLAQGYAAPKTGDPLFMNGVKVGSISDVLQKVEDRENAQLTMEDRLLLKLKPDELGKAREIYVLAKAQLPLGQLIPEGTTGEISVNVTGTRELALKPGRFPRYLSDEDTWRNPIPTTAAGSLSDIAKSISEVLGKISMLVERGDVLLEDVRGVVQALKTKIDALDVLGLQGEAKAALANLKDAFSTIRVRVDEIGGKIGAAADDIRLTSSETAAIVKAAAPELAQILLSLKEAAAKISEIATKAAPKVDAILDELALAAKAAGDLGRDLQGVGPKLKGILGEAGTDLDRVLKRFEEVGHNLVDASEDLRAHPWKLLNKPDEKEIAYENLRSAASNYVRAAAAIQRAAEDLMKLQAREDLPMDELKPLVAAALTTMKGALARYQEAEEIYNRLFRQGGGPAGPVK
jgi:ABC-type transporter Mla subunit MlaD